MIRQERRKARKVHRCSRCNHRIEPGEVYLFSVASPHHDDLGNTNWWALDECAGCATICGRGHLLEII